MSIKPLKKRSTTIHEDVRRTLGISRDIYAFCAYVHYRCADSRQKRSGWCCDNKQDVADFVGVTRPGLYKMAERLQEIDLIEISSFGDYRATPKWVDAETNCKQSLQNAPANSVNKVYKNCKQSLQNGGKNVNKVDTDTLYRELDIKLEGERTPPSPNPSNLQSQKNESGLVAPPGRDAAELFTKRISEEDFQDCLNRAAGNGQNAPLPKVAPKCIPPAGVESWPIDCEFCDGRGMKILDGGPVYCAECGGTGIEPAESNPQNFEVTAIASPTGLPGVTIVEAAPRPLRYDEYPNPRNANELKDRLKEYFTHHPEDWRLLIENAKVNWMPEKLEETTLAYCLHQEKEGNMKRTYNTYKAGLTTWFMRQKSWDAQNNAPKEGGATRQTPPQNYTSQTRH